MGFFDAIFGRKPAVPADLRALLFDAVAAGDEKQFAKACAAHEEAIIAEFGGWAKVPEAFRTPDKLPWYGQGLIAVARHFAEERGRPELFEVLSPAKNPLSEWQTALTDAASHIEAGRFSEGAALLRTTIERVEAMSGPAADEYMHITFGRLGECLFHSGDMEGARDALEAALERCEGGGDDAAVVEYASSLYEAHRYAGRADEAAETLGWLAKKLDRIGEPRTAEKWRKQAAIVKRGEPLCRVVAEIDGEQLELSEVSRPEGSARFIFVRNRLSLAPANQAVEAGGLAVEEGNLEAAIAHFDRASKADPMDPRPSYHRASALAHLKRYQASVDDFALTERLAPGWYHSRADGWLARELAAGRVDHETFVRLRKLLDGGLEPERAIALAKEGFAKAPLSLFQLSLGHALSKLNRQADAEQAFRKALAIAEEPDVRTRILVALGSNVAAEDERTRLLTEAVERSGNLVAAAMAVVLLAAANSSNSSVPSR